MFMSSMLNHHHPPGFQNLSLTSRAAMRGVPRITVSKPTVAPRPTPPTSYRLFSIFLR
jgi:hypothetical protein